MQGPAPTTETVRYTVQEWNDVDRMTNASTYEETRTLIYSENDRSTYDLFAPESVIGQPYRIYVPVSRRDWASGVPPESVTYTEFPYRLTGVSQATGTYYYRVEPALARSAGERRFLEEYLALPNATKRTGRRDIYYNLAVTATRQEGGWDKLSLDARFNGLPRFGLMRLIDGVAYQLAPNRVASVWRITSHSLVGSEQATARELGSTGANPSPLVVVDRTSGTTTVAIPSESSRPPQPRPSAIRPPLRTAPAVRQGNIRGLSSLQPTTQPRGPSQPTRRLPPPIRFPGVGRTIEEPAATSSEAQSAPGEIDEAVAEALGTMLWRSFMRRRAAEYLERDPSLGSAEAERLALADTVANIERFLNGPGQQTTQPAPVGVLPALGPLGASLNPYRGEETVVRTGAAPIRPPTRAAPTTFIPAQPSAASRAQRGSAMSSSAGPRGTAAAEPVPYVLDVQGALVEFPDLRSIFEGQEIAQVTPEGTYIVPNPQGEGYLELLPEQFAELQSRYDQASGRARLPGEAPRPVVETAGGKRKRPQVEPSQGALAYRQFQAEKKKQYETQYSASNPEARAELIEEYLESRGEEARQRDRALIDAGGTNVVLARALTWKIGQEWRRQRPRAIAKARSVAARAGTLRLREEIATQTSEEGAARPARRARRESPVRMPQEEGQEEEEATTSPEIGSPDLTVVGPIEWMESATPSFAPPSVRPQQPQQQPQPQVVRALGAQRTAPLPTYGLGRQFVPNESALTLLRLRQTAAEQSQLLPQQLP